MRKLTAVLACRNTGSRLYGKPLQNLSVEKGITILDHIICLLKKINVISDIVLAISEGEANKVFIEYSKKHFVNYIIGDEKDVLSRLITGAKISIATDIFRITTESPFPCYSMIETAYQLHIENKNDATFYMKDLPDGAGFEIIKLTALEKSHEQGNDKHRSELCTLFIRENINKFKVLDIEPDKHLQRGDLRLTVDYPEDLIVCREVYNNFFDKVPFIELYEIINFFDKRTDLKNILLRIS